MSVYSVGFTVEIFNMTAAEVYVKQCPKPKNECEPAGCNCAELPREYEIIWCVTKSFLSSCAYTYLQNSKCWEHPEQTQACLV